MRQKVTVSFKRTTKDTNLFKVISAQEEKSDFIKKALRYYLKHNKNLEGE